MWPPDADALIAYQKQLALAAPDPVAIDPSVALVAGCWVCFPRGLAGPGTDHDPAWCAAVIMRGEVLLEHRTIGAVAGAPYVAGLMALRIGRLLEEAVGALAGRPDVVLLDAIARDDPREPGWRCIWGPSRTSRPSE
jgi:deoxyribonuclease V